MVISPPTVALGFSSKESLRVLARDNSDITHNEENITEREIITATVPRYLIDDFVFSKKNFILFICNNAIRNINYSIC